MEVTGTAMLLGWLAERVLDTGIRVPGIGAAAGVVGFYAGAWLWDLTGRRVRGVRLLEADRPRRRRPEPLAS